MGFLAGLVLAAPANAESRERGVSAATGFNYALAYADWQARTTDLRYRPPRCWRSTRLRAHCVIREYGSFTLQNGQETSTFLEPVEVYRDRQGRIVVWCPTYDDWF